MNLPTMSSSSYIAWHKTLHDNFENVKIFLIPYGDQLKLRCKWLRNCKPNRLFHTKSDIIVLNLLSSMLINQAAFLIYSNLQAFLLIWNKKGFFKFSVCCFSVNSFHIKQYIELNDRQCYKKSLTVCCFNVTVLEKMLL